jgi:DNA polymerase III alpha subunit
VKNFATCHCHPQSLDSASTPDAFVKRELELGTGVITCTDHGTLAACRKIYDLGKANKLIPVLGMEGYLRDDDCPILTAHGYQKNATGAFVNAPKYMHFCVHFMDQPAYECGVRLLSQADARLEETLAKMEAKDRKHGQERKPLFTWRDLEELGAHNVTMTTGCMIGVVQRHLLDNGDVRTAEAYFDRMLSIVKPGNLYTELNPHDTSKDWVEGVFITLEGGEKLRFYKDKTLMTNVGEISAIKLAKAWGQSDHAILRSVKDRSTWREMPEQKIVQVEHVEGFLQNECKPWAPDGNWQAGLNRAMRLMARKRGVKLLVGDDSHFAHPDEKVVQDVRLAQAGPWRFYGSYHRQSSEEAFEHFQRTLGTSQAEFESWVENSHEWAGRFKDFVFNTPPSLPTKFYEAEYAKRPWFKEGDADNSLRYTRELIKKHGRMDWKAPAMVERLRAEINLLHYNGTIDLLPYFMIDEEACSVYEEAGLLTGPGRGSAAGLLLTHLLGITHVDPLRFGLSMDRFLTVDRISSGKLPDIDQDLPHRELLVDPDTGWLKKRFGDHFAQISVDTTLKLKMAVKDVSRAMRGHVPPDIEILTKKFMMPPQGVTDFNFVMGYTPEGTDDPIQGSIEYDPSLQDYVRKYPNDWEVVKKCLGLARQKSRHACAYVIANRPISSFIPLTTVSDVRVTAYTAPSVEAVGGLKMDFLVINSLNDIGDAIKLIQRRSGDTFHERVITGKRVPAHRQVPFVTGLQDIWDIWDLPEDQKVFADIATGKTETVFQFNTPGAVQWMEHFAYRKSNGNYAIESIEGMAAFTALDRPGPLDITVKNPEDGSKHNMLVEYARRARGALGSPEVLAAFERILPETYGVMVYQEQLQRAYQQLTGCSGPEAEEFRTLVAKKKMEKVQKLQAPFIEAATAKLGEADARAAWEFFITWGQYGFNKSHAVCYSVIGYACAWLKHHYPLEWWTSVLRNASKNEVSEKFWKYCGHIIDLPDVTLSGSNFEIQGERIRAPLSLLHGVGETAHKQLTTYAPYTDIDDFCRKIEEHRTKTGHSTMKRKTIKDKTAPKVRNEKGNLVFVDKDGEVEVFKKGYSAINRKVVQTLILSGAMDSLFPPEMHVGEQLVDFERALAVATGVKKPKSIDPKLWDVSQLTRYQMRKAILPAYGADLVPMVVGMEVTPHLYLHEATQSIVYRWTSPYGKSLELGVAGASDLDRYERAKLSDGESIQIAVICYIDDVRVWRYGEERREACELQINVEGGRYKFVKWAGKAIDLPAHFKAPLKGAVVIAVLNKYKEGRPFSIEDVYVVQSPLDYSDDSEETNEDNKDETK